MTKKYAVFSDIDLIRLFRGNKSEAEAAFTELYRRYSSLVHSYCLRILNNQQQAEDIFQETFIRFYQKINPDGQFTNVPGYLIRIARNLCLNYKRDKIKQASIDDYDFGDNSIKSYENKELLDLIAASLDLLGYDYREAFVMREYNGLTYNEIADICGISLENAKSRVFRAKQKIKNILTPYMKDLCK